MTANMPLLSEMTENQEKHCHRDELMSPTSLGWTTDGAVRLEAAPSAVPALWSEG